MFYTNDFILPLRYVWHVKGRSTIWSNNDHATLINTPVKVLTVNFCVKNVINTVYGPLESVVDFLSLEYSGALSFQWNQRTLILEHCHRAPLHENHRASFRWYKIERTRRVVDGGPQANKQCAPPPPPLPFTNEPSPLFSLFFQSSWLGEVEQCANNEVKRSIYVISKQLADLHKPPAL